MRDERQVAIHEAGHALAYLVANDWARFPDFVSIVPGRDYLGVMIESFCQTHRTEQQITVREMGVRLKTLLGGRAAEQCVFGDEEVSAFGAVDDLAEVRAIAQRLVAEAGIVVEAGSIRVRPWAMRADAGDTEAAAIASATLALVEHCWNEVVAMIREHRALLLRIADALIARRCLIDSDMRALIEADAKRFEWAA
jgi:ATP-dependent Zn protease